MLKALQRRAFRMIWQNQERVLRSSLGLSGRVCPGLTAQLALKLFMKPAQFRRTTRENRRLAEAQTFRIQSQGEKISLWKWGEGPCILLVHGWSGRGGQLHSFVQPLLQAGFSVLAFDAPAHGDSGGEQSSLLHFSQAIADISLEFGPFYGAIAHSLGGPSVLWAMKQGLGLEKLVLISSPYNLERMLMTFSRRMGLTPKVFFEMKKQLETRFEVTIQDFDFFQQAATMNLPLLVVHDLEDQEVDWSSAEKLVRHWPASRLMTTKGYGHYRILKKLDVIEKVTQFLSESEVLAENMSPAMGHILDQKF